MFKLPKSNTGIDRENDCYEMNHNNNNNNNQKEKERKWGIKYLVIYSEGEEEIAINEEVIKTGQCATFT